MPGCRPAARHPVLAAPADQADDNGRASTRHAGQSTPAMPMHWTSRMALPHRGVQRRLPRPASDRPLPARRPAQKKFRACCPVSRFPRFRSPVRSRAPCQPEHLRPSPVPLVTIVTAISQRTRSQRPRVTGCRLSPPGITGQHLLHRNDRMPGSGRFQSRRRGFGLGVRPQRGSTVVRPRRAVSRWPALGAGDCCGGHVRRDSSTGLVRPVPWPGGSAVIASRASQKTSGGAAASDGRAG